MRLIILYHFVEVMNRIIHIKTKYYSLLHKKKATVMYTDMKGSNSLKLIIDVLYMYITK